MCHRGHGDLFGGRASCALLQINYHYAANLLLLADLAAAAFTACGDVSAAIPDERSKVGWLGVVRKALFLGLMHRLTLWVLDLVDNPFC